MSNVNFKIVDIFESVKDDMFSIQPYLSINKNLKNFTTNTFSLSIPMELDGFGIDGDAEMISLIRAEMNQSIYKTILKELFNTSKFDYIDISKTVNTHQSVNEIIDFLGVDYINNKYKYLVTNTSMANSIGDSSLFNFKPSASVVESQGLPYLFGSLIKYDVYMDPFMKFDDNRICLFDSCEINIENINQTVTSVATFAPKMMISYDVAFKIGDSKVIFILDGNESSSSYKQYKQLQRDIKINSLLDGSTD